MNQQLRCATSGLRTWTVRPGAGGAQSVGRYRSAQPSPKAGGAIVKPPSVPKRPGPASTASRRTMNRRKGGCPATVSAAASAKAKPTRAWPPSTLRRLSTLPPVGQPRPRCSANAARSPRRSRPRTPRTPRPGCQWPQPPHRTDDPARHFPCAPWPTASRRAASPGSPRGPAGRARIGSLPAGSLAHDAARYTVAVVRHPYRNAPDRPPGTLRTLRRERCGGSPPAGRLGAEEAQGDCGQASRAGRLRTLPVGSRFNRGMETHLSAAASLGNCPRARMALCMRAFTDSLRWPPARESASGCCSRASWRLDWGCTPELPRGPAFMPGPPKYRQIRNLFDRIPRHPM